MVPTPANVPALKGHTDTIPDIVGRLGSRIDLAIFAEGNHFPALLGGGIINRRGPSLSRFGHVENRVLE
jgi:hypothetical protein